MYTIYFVFNNRYETQRCRNKEVLQICYTALLEEGANIICIKDCYNNIITIN